MEQDRFEGLSKEQREWLAEVTATPEAASKVLQEIGLIDKNGKLTRPYDPKYVNKEISYRWGYNQPISTLGD